MQADKLARARAIVETVLACDECHGVLCPSHGHGAETRGRRISPPSEPWYAQLNPDRRMTIGRVFQNTVGDRLVEAEGWTTITIVFRNEKRFVANVRGDEIELHFFMPGLWESWFNSDPGSDSQTFCRMPFGDARSAEWKALRLTRDYNLPPLRE